MVSENFRIEQHLSILLDPGEALKEADDFERFH